jgi:hypothetical protein
MYLLIAVISFSAGYVIGNPERVTILRDLFKKKK